MSTDTPSAGGHAVTGMEQAIEYAARTLFLSDRSDTLPKGFSERQWDEGHAVKDDYLRRARALAEAGLLMSIPAHRNGDGESIEEAYQRGYEAGYEKRLKEES